MAELVFPRELNEGRIAEPWSCGTNVPNLEYGGFICGGREFAYSVPLRALRILSGLTIDGEHLVIAKDADNSPIVRLCYLNNVCSYILDGHQKS